MRLKNAIERRNDAKAAIRSLYNRAAHFGMTSEQLTAEKTAILERLLVGTPEWVRVYIDGYAQALVDALYESTLVYGGFYCGGFYSTHSNRPDYYGRHNIAPSEWAKSGKVERRGHYWPATESRGVRPFFLG